MHFDSVLVFGVFEFDQRTGELRKRGVRLKLQPQAAAVLSLLLRDAGKLVSRDQLRDELWPDVNVDPEHGIGISISKLRIVLNDTAANPRFIETLPRRGYRFIAPVREVTGSNHAPARLMIAVLPFDDLASPGLDDYFADGLTEEVINTLGRLNPKSLGVIARASILRYQGMQKSPREIGQELGVNYLLYATIRRGNNRLRINAQLVRTSDQSSIWNGCYDHQCEDVFDMQRDLALQIANSLKIELMPSPDPKNLAAPGPSVEAFELYLQGRFQWNRRTPQGTANAIEYFQKALAIAPDYALAHVGLADSFAVLGFYGDIPPSEAFGRAKQYCHRALELDDNLAEAHSCLAFCHLEYDWDWPTAQREHLLAIQLNANCAPAFHWHGITLTQVEKFAEAQQAFTRALELDPYDSAIHAQAGRLAFFCRDYTRCQAALSRASQLDRGYAAARYFQAMLWLETGNSKGAIALLEDLRAELDDYPIVLSGLVYALGKSGKCNAALHAFERLCEVAKTRRVSPYFFAFAEAGMQRTESTLQYLEQAHTERFCWMFYLKMDPAFDFLRMNPRFVEMVQTESPKMRAVSRSAQKLDLSYPHP